MVVNRIQDYSFERESSFRTQFYSALRKNRLQDARANNNREYQEVFNQYMAPTNTLERKKSLARVLRTIQEVGIELFEKDLNQLNTSGGTA